MIAGTGAESIAANIEAAISQGTLAPGDALPPIRDLAAQLYQLEAPLSDAAFRTLAEPWKPFRTWAAVLIHSPDVNSRYPLPYGYITADPSIVEPYKHLIAELTAKAEGTRAVLWTKSGEDAHRALASIDTALGISVA